MVRLIKSLKVALPMFAIGGLATIAQVRSANPPLGYPHDWAWLITHPNPWVLLTAMLSAIGAVSAVMTFFQPKPYSNRRGKEDRAHQNQSFDTLDRREAERHERTQAELATLSRRIEEVVAGVTASGQAAPQQAESFGEALTELAQSEDATDRAIAEQAIEGDPVAAADRLMGEVGEGKLRNAERARQAARLYAPFSPSKALAAYREATELDPADVSAWIELGRLRARYESLDAARHCFEIALQRVFDEQDRATIDTELGNLAMAEGDLDEARRRFAAGRAIRERLAEREPRNSVWQRDLSVSQNKLGNLAVAEGDLGGARRRFGAGLAIRKRLAEREPRNSVWQRDLSVSQNMLGNLAVAEGDLGEARRRFGAGLAIRERLAEFEPRNSLWQRDLSVSQIKLGNLAVTEGDLGEARRRFAAGRAIAKRLAAREPDNSLWQRDLSVSQNKLGEVAMAEGDLGEARRRFAAGLAIRKQLAEREPGNSVWQRDLSVSHNRLGEVAVAARDLGEARRHFEADAAIAKRLAEREPGNSVWQRDLSVSYVKLGEMAVAEGDTTAAIVRFEQAEGIIAALVRQRPDHPRFVKDLGYVRGGLARLRR